MGLILILTWIVPGILLLSIWAAVDLYRVTRGSEKEISWTEKRAFPTVLGTVFSFIPVFNIILLVGSIIELIDPENRKRYL